MRSRLDATHGAVMRLRPLRSSGTRTDSDIVNDSMPIDSRSRDLGPNHACAGPIHRKRGMRLCLDRVVTD